MKVKIRMIVLMTIGMGLFLYQRSLSYPPGVGITGKAKNCLVCHANNGPWQDEGNTIIDILDGETKNSLRQPDGSFLIEVPRRQTKSVLTVIGRAKGDTAESPYRNAWIYVDPKRIETDSLSKFAQGWSTNLPLSCRLVGDNLEGFEGAKITVLPMTIMPGDDARDAELELQVMLTKGESIKGKPKQGMLGNYLVRPVRLKVSG
jgi:hypothetical protein